MSGSLSERTGWFAPSRRRVADLDIEVDRAEDPAR